MTKSTTLNALNIVAITIITAVLFIVIFNVSFHSHLLNSYLQTINDLAKPQYLKPSSPKKDEKFSLLEQKEVIKLLWEDMTTSQQEVAYKMVLPYLKKQANNIKNRINQGKGKWKLNSFKWSCGAKVMGGGWSGHYVCPELLQNLSTCNFFSFGIHNEYTFEKLLVDTFQCHGFAGDPTVEHNSKIYKNVTFHQLGAQLLHPNMEQKGGITRTGNHYNEVLKENQEETWWLTSIPLLRKTLGSPHLNVLKMDCEGCEYGLAKDIIRHDPSFFEHVDQFVVEVHLAREWLNSTETLYYYGFLLKMLDDYGLRLHDVRAASCAPEHTKTGCIENFLCGDPNRCQNYLFAKM